MSVKIMEKIIAGTAIGVFRVKVLVASATECIHLRRSEPSCPEKNLIVGLVSSLICPTAWIVLI